MAAAVVAFTAAVGHAQYAPAPRPLVKEKRNSLDEVTQEPVGKVMDLSRSRPELAEDLRRPSSLVISGGVSLGAYQAGFLHFYTQHLLAWRDFARNTLGLDVGDRGGFRIATGASAGSINAFLAVVAGCQKPRPDPEQSLFFNTWIPVGIAELSAPSPSGERSLFTRKPIDAAVQRIEDLWGQSPAVAGWAELPCRAFLGMTVTRMKGRSVSLAGATSPYEGKVAINRQSEKFLLVLQGGGQSRAPEFRPFVPNWGMSVNRSPFGLYPVLGNRSDRVELRHVMDLLRASSGFPVAFEPYELTYSFWRKPPAWDGTSYGGGELEPAERADFIDGGVFDNTPLLLAERMDEWIANTAHQRAGGEQRARRAARPEGRHPFTVFLEPDAIGWQKREAPPPALGEKDRSIFGMYFPFIGEFVRTARGAELQQSIETDPDLADSLSIPPRMMPVASAQMLNFLGFFEKSFRVFDFYMGMVDAWDYLRSHSAQYKLMETHLARSGVEPVRVLSAVFDCFKEHRRRIDQGQTVNPRALDQCRPLAAGAGSRSVPSANLLALLDSAVAVKLYTRTAGYDPGGEDDVFFRALGAHGFRFLDLQAMIGHRVDAGNAQAVIRELVQEGMHRLGVRQPRWWQNLPTSMVTKASANLLRYQIPAATLDVGFVSNRGLELAFAARLGYSRWTAGLGLRWQPVENDLVDAAARSYAWAMRTALVANLAVEPWANAVLQTRIAAGWTGVARSRWAAPVEATVLRHGPQLTLAASLFQRFYLATFGTYYLDDCGSNPACTNVKTTSPVLTRAVDVAFTLGFRLTIP